MVFLSQQGRIAMNARGNKQKNIENNDQAGDNKANKSVASLRVERRRRIEQMAEEKILERELDDYKFILEES